ncbi:hypothetical protein [Peptoniphilus phoceensis]|uniref:hypothetical protein n=1 Tax=Peptoniphilus phoceensis TaxID=1720298 RepID=UPI000782F4F6|nr:hypothetical protein [Peptoniphilus phoceensis]
MTKEKKEWLITSIITIILSIVFLVFKYNNLDTNNFVKVFNFKSLAIFLGIVSISTLIVFFFVDEKRYKDTKSFFIYMIILMAIDIIITLFRFKTLEGVSPAELEIIKFEIKKLFLNIGIYVFVFLGIISMSRKNDKIAEEIALEKEETNKNMKKTNGNKKKKNKK